MGSFIFEEIANFSRKQTAFSVHPRPISLSALPDSQKQYIDELSLNVKKCK